RAEVGHLHQPFAADDHVRRAEIAVNDAASVRVIDRVANLADVVERHREIERAVACDDRLERFAGHVLHHDEEHVLRLFGREDAAGGGMFGGARGPRAAQHLYKSAALLGGSFQPPFLSAPLFFGELPPPNPAAADCREDFVLADDLSSEKHGGEYSSW